MSTSDDAQAQLATARRAMKDGSWHQAAEAYHHALSLVDIPEAHDGLGLAYWWLNEIQSAHHHRMLAYNGFRREGKTGSALRAACWLAREQVFLNGNVPAMRGWFDRAERLLAEQVSLVDAAWFDIMQASMLSQPNELELIADRCTAVARTTMDGDLEAFSLALAGLARVARGFVDAGMSQLDEALTMASGGEVTDLAVSSEIFCFMLSTCEIAGDLARAEHWCRVAAEFAERYKCAFLSAYCRAHYGGLMTAQGRWADAEVALKGAIEAFQRGHRGLMPHAVIRLADLRVQQGRLDEAEIMLAGLDDYDEAALPLARMSLFKGEPTLAKALVERALPRGGQYTLAHVPALLALVEVHLQLDDVAAAKRSIEALERIAAVAQSSYLGAQLSFANGMIALRDNDPEGARHFFGQVIDSLRMYERSVLAGRTRLQMAKSLVSTDIHAAIAWARGALATFERIGSQHEAEKATALLRTLGVTRATPQRSETPLTNRELEIAALAAHGLTNREIATRLVISPKTVEHHVGRVLNKLNLRTRVELAAFIASGRLHTAILDEQSNLGDQDRG